MNYNVTNNISISSSKEEKSFGTFYNTITEIASDEMNESSLTIEDIYKKLKKIFSPYPDKDEIPVLKIKNKICFLNDEKIIEPQLSESIFADNKFNKCKNHDNNDNEFFCEKCGKNICNKCSNNCKNNGHKLINLKDLKRDAEINKNQIQKFLSKILKILPGFQINNKPICFSWNIVVIKAIIGKDYNNYFHYKNINECHRYLGMNEKIYNDFFLSILHSVNRDIYDKEKDYKIFGQTFVENNKDKIYLLINGIKSDLVETIKINDNDKLLEITLLKKSDNIIDDLSFMFCNCKSKSILLYESEERIKILENVENVSSMFKNCSYLKNINLHFFHAFKKLKCIDSLFSGCEELVEISNLTHLNTISVTKMDRIFEFCKNIKDLEGIENFETDNVESFEEMFKDCVSLEGLPKKISEWNMGKAKCFKNMFKGCSALKQLPDIKGWIKENVGKVESLKGMFEGCSSLGQLPDIGLWKVENVKTMKKMFKGCSALIELPKNIVYWNVGKVRNMEKMFYGCHSLGIQNLPDFKNWNLENLEKMDKMFFDCFNLINREKVKFENLFTFKNNEKVSYKNILGKKK